MKKINRLLAFLLAFTVVISTFSSDLTTAKVFATEEETVIDTEDKINTVEKEKVDEPVVVAPTEASTEGSTEESVEASTEGTTTDDTETPKPEDETEVTEENNDAATAGTEGEVVNPDAAVEETKKDDEVRVKEFKESKTIDGIEISLYAEPEVLPDDAILDITKVEDDDEERVQELIDEELGEEVEVKKTFSYDINIVSSETGEKYKPEDGTVEVTFSRIQEAASDDVSLEVYHVKDDLSSAESVSDVVEEGTEISFDAEHFSIYAVTLFYENDKKNVSFNAGVYDLDGNKIDKDNTIRKVDMNDKKEQKNVDPSVVAPVIHGYSFDHATTADGKTIRDFYISNDKNKSLKAHVQGSGNGVVISKVAEEAVKFYYKTTVAGPYVTKNHIDLGFTDLEMSKVVKAEISINDGSFIEMEEGIDESDLGVKEKRLKLPKTYYDTKSNQRKTIEEVRSTDKITFRVTVVDEENTTPGHVGTGLGIGIEIGSGIGIGIGIGIGAGGSNNQKTKSYTYTCSTAENENAYERCINAHKYRQDEFGFDYKFNFREKFNYGATIQYHSNWGTDATNDIPVSWETQTAGGKKNETLVEKSKYATVVTGPNSTCTFLGWGTTPNATEYVTEVEVENGKTTHVYAIWQKYTVSFVDLDDENVKYAQDQIVLEGQKVDASKVQEPSKGDDYVFEGWFVKDENDELNEFDFNTAIENDTTVYAKWSAAEVYVAVYATDGTSNTTENPQLKEKLGLNYVQDDAYYPVGVIKLPTSLFKNDDGTKKTSPYIKNEDDFKKVMDSFKNLDKTKLIRNGAQNNGNTVADNLKYVQYNENGTAGSFKTALFDWNKHEHYDGNNNTWNGTNIATVDGKNYKYHLDLRFTTNTVKYIGVYPEGKTTDDESTATDTQTKAYLTSTEVTVPSADDFVLKGTDKGNYSVAGYYTDPALTTEYVAEKAAITSDKVVYVKLVKAEVDKNYTVEFYYQNDEYKYDDKMVDTQTLTVKVPSDPNKDGVTVSCVAANESDITKAFNFSTQNNITTYTGAFTKDGVKYIEDKTYEGRVYSGEVKNKTDNNVVLKVYFKRVVPEGYHVVVNVTYDAKGADNMIMYDGKQHNGKVGVAVSASTSYSTEDTTSDTSSDNATNPLVEVANVVIQGVVDGAKKLLNLGVLVVSAAEPEEDKFVITAVPTAEAVTAGGLTADISGLVVKSEKGTNVGTYDVLLDKSNVKVETVIDGKTVELSNIDVEVLVNGKKLAKAENEIFETSEDKIGTLTIYERDVKLTSESYSRAYNGSVLTRPIVQVDGHGFVDGEVENLRATGSVLNAGDRAVNTIVYDTTEKFDEKNYTIAKNEGVLEITATGGNDDDDDDDDDDDTPATVVDAPVPAAPAAAVLGAVREPVAGDAPAVLGARRAGTSDTNILGSIITIIVAAAIAFSMVFIKRKKKEEN